jgi:hypothetical protein
MDFLGNIIFGIRIFDWLILIFLCYLFGRTTIISNQIARVHIDVNRDRDEGALRSFRQDNRLDEKSLDEDKDEIIPNRNDTNNTRDDSWTEKKEPSFTKKAAKFSFWFIISFIVVVAIMNSK